jgi:hypothetical protein
MESVKNLYHQYWGQIMAWYDGLAQINQYGVFFLLIVFSLFIGSFFILSRLTK